MFFWEMAVRGSTNLFHKSEINPIDAIQPRNSITLLKPLNRLVNFEGVQFGLCANRRKPFAFETVSLTLQKSPACQADKRGFF